MNSVRRLAGQAWTGYKDNVLVQDLVETAIMTLGVAGAQALFSEMTPEEIAIAAGVGVGAGLAGRPIGNYLGVRAGRAIDERFPQSSKDLRDQIESGMKMTQELGDQHSAAKPVAEYIEAKMKHHLTPDAGAYEATLGYIGRQRGDNLAQGAVGALAPFVMGRSSSEEEA